MGFGIALAALLRGTLREWAESLLAADRLRPEGYLDTVSMGAARRGHRLWSVLMFQTWKEGTR